MSFHPPSLRVSSQDTIVDVIFPSSEVSWSLLDVELPPILDKHMYGESESIKSWIDTINRVNPPVFKLDVTDNGGVFRFAGHPFGTCRPHSPFSDEFGLEIEVSPCLDASTWAPEVLTSSYYDDSDESCSESSLSGDAQYIIIPFDSPWYRPPSSNPAPISAHELTTTVYANSCSSEVRQAIAQQEFLVAIFYDELRRIVPSNDDTEYDPDWLEDVDAELVLAPLEAYANLCWESVLCEESPSLGSDRQVPDVPIGFDETYNTY